MMTVQKDGDEAVTTQNDDSYDEVVTVMYHKTGEKMAIMKMRK